MAEADPIIVLGSMADRAKAMAWIERAPVNTRIMFRAPKRTLPQNDKFWSMLTDVATQLKWHGVRLTVADWKLIFLDALNREMRIVPNLDGNGFVNLGRSSSRLSKDEMSQLIELIAAFGAQHDIKFHDGQGGGAANNRSAEAA